MQSHWLVEMVVKNWWTPGCSCVLFRRPLPEHLLSFSIEVVPSSVHPTSGRLLWTGFSPSTSRILAFRGLKSTACTIIKPSGIQSNNEFLDNVLIATSLFVLVILLKDITMRIVYMRQRFSEASDTIKYFSQARILLLDNSFLFRWVRRFRLFDAGPYNQRSHIQYTLVMLVTGIMFLLELGLVVSGLPANRLIYRDSDKTVRWESEYLDKGKIILPRDHRCIIAPVLDGANVKSDSWWSHCRYRFSAPSNSTRFPLDKMMWQTCQI